MYQELRNQLNQLTANITLDENDAILIAELPDPRFDLPFSGLYWQVVEIDGDSIFSRSLWGDPIATPNLNAAGEQVRGRTITAQDETLLTLSWRILFGDTPEPRTLDLTVGIDEVELTRPLQEFRQKLIQWLALMFVFLILASWVQVRLGLSPLEAIREKIQGIRSGSDKRLVGTFPAEVMPLASEVNELLELHETSLNSARARASDLAHGLKTPLTIMLTHAADLEEDGQAQIAKEIREQVNSMHHYVERELARTRLQVPSGKRSLAKPVIEKMVKMIAKLPREAPLQWDTDIPDALETPFDAHDLSELMGNMLDNARKWAKSVVHVQGVIGSHGSATLIVEDDGPGVPEELIETILARGGRLDDNVQGTGLGLAICADMAKEYGADLSFSRSELGGLRVSFEW